MKPIIGQWISVNESLPSEYEQVLVWLSKPLKFGERIALSYTSSGVFTNINGSRWQNMPSIEYWMHLPKPPKQLKVKMT